MSMKIQHLLAATFALAAAGADAQHEGHRMPGALGPQSITREASGTSWQPDAAPMDGHHVMGETWTVMLHGYADLVYDRQGGPRGDEKVFVPSMFMAMGQRAAGPGTWGLRAMVSLDPFMGRDGYPLLFQTGESADGVEPLVDRQHPHDAFMELATTYSVAVGEGSVFGYLGLPGEPALGPPAFMHRASGMAIPEAPLSHHWLDSSHISFGVVTLGATSGSWKLDASAFNAREPDQHRWNIETEPLDSWSARVTFNPGEHWSAQVSHGRLESPEQLEPDENVERTTASISHTATMAQGTWSTTLAWGENRHHSEASPAWLLESVRHWGRWTLFGRGEAISNDHLVEAGPLAGREFDIDKLSLGGSYRVAEAAGLAFDLGALLSNYRIPEELEVEYGSDPVSGMVFLRASID
jgi:hypothetical protein